MWWDLALEDMKLLCFFDLAPISTQHRETRTVFFFYCFITSVNKATTETSVAVVAPPEGGKKENDRYVL